MMYATEREVLLRMGQGDVKSGPLVVNAQQAIVAATEAIELDVDRVFSRQLAGVRTFRTSGTDVLNLPDFTGISLLELDDNDTGVFGTVIAASRFEADKYEQREDWPFDHVRLLDRLFPWTGHRRRRVRVTADWGWAAIPEGINQACSLLAVRLLQRPQAPFGIVSFGEISTNIRYTDPDYQHLISGFKRVDGFS